jgi:hypothetical protein
MNGFLKEWWNFTMLPWVMGSQFAALWWKPTTDVMRRMAAFPHDPGPMH